MGTTLGPIILCSRYIRIQASWYNSTVLRRFFYSSTLEDNRQPVQHKLFMEQLLFLRWHSSSTASVLLHCTLPPRSDCNILKKTIRCFVSLLCRSRKRAGVAENGEEEPSDKVRVLQWVLNLSRGSILFVHCDKNWSVDLIPRRYHKSSIPKQDSHSQHFSSSVCFNLTEENSRLTLSIKVSVRLFSSYQNDVGISKSVSWGTALRSFVPEKKKKKITWGKDYLEAKEASVCLTPWHFGPISDSWCLQEENKALNLLTDVESAVKKLAEWPGIP